jgi:hypothetical protein
VFSPYARPVTRMELPFSSPVTTELRVKDALNALMKADLERQQALQRERAKEQAALDAPKLAREALAASHAYRDCLFGHAKALAIASLETAEIIREAAFQIWC